MTRNRIAKPSKNGHANGVHKPKVEPVKKGYEPLPEKVSLLVNVFTYSKSVGADVFVYTHAAHQLPKTNPRVTEVAVSYCAGYPTDRMRNAVVAEAKKNGHHFVLMLDDDMHPDLGLSSQLHADAEAVPFLPTALDFMLKHDGPCCVGAPYTSGPPSQEVVVMKHRQRFPDMPDGCGGFLDKFTRDEAAVQKGIQRVMALPTGVMIVDLRILDILQPPWFSYEFKDAPYNTQLASTEDVVFSRNCDWMGIPQYCHWSAWAGHCKHYTTAKPVISPVPEIPRSIWKALDKGWKPPIPV